MEREVVRYKRENRICRWDGQLGQSAWTRIWKDSRISSANARNGLGEHFVSV